MSREIKFRAWDNHHKIMICQRETDRVDKCLTYFETNIKVNLMQYTGLKDKNGVEIYEGDVLGGVNGSINGTAWKIDLFAVEYNICKGFNLHMFMWDDEGNLKMDSTHYCEVIGNIHENPELLEHR